MPQEQGPQPGKPRPTKSDLLGQMMARVGFQQYLEAYSQESRPFVWTKSASEILENLRNYCERVSLRTLEAEGSAGWPAREREQ